MANERLVYPGMRTPWGSAQTASLFITGIGIVSTASHGGIKLSRERNSQVPEYARQEGGWYEEDCLCAIPLTIFMDELKKSGPTWLQESLEKYNPAETWANWYPDSYMQYTGKTLSLSESMVLRDRDFARIHANDWVTMAAWGDWQDGVPKGMVGVVANLGGRRTPDGAPRRYFLIPGKEYDARDVTGGFVIDLVRHQEVADFTKARTA